MPNRSEVCHMPRKKRILLRSLTLLAITGTVLYKTVRPFLVPASEECAPGDGTKTNCGDKTNCGGKPMLKERTSTLSVLAIDCFAAVGGSLKWIHLRHVVSQSATAIP